MAEAVHAWHPDVPGVREALHATFEHAYPVHTHTDWTVLIVDTGAVAYALDRAEHHATRDLITVLPPDVPHDGRPAVPGQPYRKRVLYFESDWLPGRCIGAAVDNPSLRDLRAISILTRVHAALDDPGEAMAAESGVLMLRDALLGHLGAPASHTRDTPLARRLRDLLDERFPDTITIADAATALGVHPSHLVRSFSQAYGIPPHRYLTGRRVDLARHLLLTGHTPAQAATEAGFHDQAHLTRHFRKTLGTTPGTYAA
ncbi:MAG: AraC family transcriptional regulator [Actinobacteria bacterium]|nr:AraC family transcriptional regulator [Actinomycetota bacterium]